jgi:antirestriction protein ArdC
MKELVAELGITPEPRADHAQYITHWLGVLKADKKAIFTAASKAQAAVDYLRGVGLRMTAARPHVTHFK